MAKNPTASGSKLLDDPEIHSSHDLVAGQTISKWTQDWWTWAVNMTDGANPFSHPDGNFAGVNNDGSVFFISGVSQTNQIDVSFGKPILVPLVNFIDAPLELTHNKHNQNIPDDLTTSRAIHATENANIKSFDGSVTSLFAEIDGVPVSDLFKHLVDSSFFSMGTAQAGTLATDYFQITPAGVAMDPSKSGGYWLMIDNLAPGNHTLHFGGTSTAFGGFTNNVTDTIKVT
jgi:hypothetical protein